MLKLFAPLFGAVLASVASAHAVTVTVSGTEYEVSTVTGTFVELEPLLTSQVFWNDEDLAGEFALAVGRDLPPANFLEGPAFAFFAFSPEFILFAAFWDQDPLNELVYVSADGTRTDTFAIAEVSAVPLPSGALLILPAIAGLTFLRRQKPA